MREFIQITMPFSDLQPLITCGALVLLGIYIYAYQQGRQVARPCTITYKVAKDTKEPDDLDDLMNKRDPFLHYEAVSNRIMQERKLSLKDEKGPKRHTILETLLTDRPH